MPVEVACACGKSFRVPDHTAGKRVKCPACSQPVAVPSAAEPERGQRPDPCELRLRPLADGEIRAGGQGGEVPRLRQARQDSGRPDGRGRTEGVRHIVCRWRGRRTCQPDGRGGAQGIVDRPALSRLSDRYAADDILCVKCGYNTETGRRLGTRRTGRKEAKQPIGRFQAKAGSKGKQSAILKICGLLVLLAAVAYLVMRQRELCLDRQSSRFAFQSPQNGRHVVDAPAPRAAAQLLQRGPEPGFGGQLRVGLQVGVRRPLRPTRARLRPEATCAGHRPPGPRCRSS